MRDGNDNNRNEQNGKNVCDNHEHKPDLGDDGQGNGDDNDDEQNDPGDNDHDDEGDNSEEENDDDDDDDDDDGDLNEDNINDDDENEPTISLSSYTVDLSYSIYRLNRWNDFADGCPQTIVNLRFANKDLRMTGVDASLLLPALEYATEVVEF
ncbi:uncharacterized protein LOC127867920 [Dreissena polymorpha]|uniref:Uncharacterized protein n=1 Tax=Dreissena polymorpha TaxID=45954 RepID=A0A9D4M3M6_DREPO|nr:uncharacterized protein LOC127867920 [Dreissena polymorpha]KAH3868986.1 hypothetical protein DPMN_032141 [Dreissena polymorpha]